MLQKTLNLEIKAIDASTGVVTAHVAGFGNIDRVGDIILPGAFLKTIPGFLADGIVLWNHDTNCPIGSPMNAGEDEKGLWVQFQLTLSVPKAKEIFDLLEAKVVKKFSIGYDVRKRTWLTPENIASFAPADATPQEIAVALGYGAVLEEIELYEVSPVSIPANNNTSLDSLKAVKAKALAEVAPTPKPEANTNTESSKALAQIKLRQFKRRAAERAKNGA